MLGVVLQANPHSPSGSSTTTPACGRVLFPRTAGSRPHVRLAGLTKARGLGYSREGVPVLAPSPRARLSLSVKEAGPLIAGQEAQLEDCTEMEMGLRERDDVKGLRRGPRRPPHRRSRGARIRRRGARRRRRPGLGSMPTPAKEGAAHPSWRAGHQRGAAWAGAGKCGWPSGRIAPPTHSSSIASGCPSHLIACA